MSISVVVSGPSYTEYDLNHTALTLRRLLGCAEVILSTNDVFIIENKKKYKSFDKIIECENVNELPSIKFIDKNPHNNIYKQIDTSLNGLLNVSSEIALKIRSDQILQSDHILKIWENLKNVPLNTEKKGRIITSSIFSIVPKISERLPYHISDMLQFGYSTDLIDYYSPPSYPFEYATWYETHPHSSNSNINEKGFRTKFAVEQWLALNYIFGNEENFPIKFHNDHSEHIVSEFEAIFPDYFFVTHPGDLSLRAKKFEWAMAYVNNECYSTFDSVNFLKNKYCLDSDFFPEYCDKGINRALYIRLQKINQSKLLSKINRLIPSVVKSQIKRIMS